MNTTLQQTNLARVTAATSGALATTENPANTAALVASLVLNGDISGLDPSQKAIYYVQRCRQLGLDPASKPFQVLKLNGKEILYTDKGAADQLAKLHNVNRKITDGPRVMKIGTKEVLFCQCEASLPNGRSEMDVATLPVADLDNALMKVTTKAKRRATLAILGLGCLDESELSTIPDRVIGERVDVDLSLAGVEEPKRLGGSAEGPLAAFRADIETVTDCRSLTACWQSHATALHATGDSDTARLDVAKRMTALRYALTGAETTAILGGTLHPAYACALDDLSEVDRHADDEDGDGVIADVVRVLRAAGDAPTASKGHIATAAIKRATALGVADAKARITSALKPPTPPAPTGTDAPRAASPADATGSAAASSPTAGAQAIGPRVVLDTDASHVQVAGTWRESEAGWAAHLAEMTSRCRVEASAGCNGALLGPRFLALAAARIVEIDAARPLPAGVARLTVLGVTQTLERIALDGSRARAAAAKRTGTDG